MDKQQYDSSASAAEHIGQAPQHGTLRGDGHGAHGHKHNGGGADLQADIAGAKLAMELWHSHNASDWDRAMDLKDSIQRKDPKAWDIAVRQLETEQAQSRHALPAPCPPEQSTSSVRRRAEVTETQLPPRREIEQTQVPPQGRVQEAQLPPPRFYGLDIGLLKLGVTDRGSIDLGVNVGLARAEVQAGLENRVEGEFMPVAGSPVHARVGAGIGFNRSGLHSEVGAGANFFNVVNGDADFGVHAGSSIGVDGDVRGRALAVNASGQAGAEVGQYGVSAYTGGGTDILGRAGIRTGGRFALGPGHSGWAAGVGTNFAGRTFDLGPSFDAYPDANGYDPVSGGVHFDSGRSDQPTFYPTGDRQLDQYE